MNIYVAFVVILVTSGAAFWVGNRVNRPRRVPVERLANPAPLPAELPRAGRLRTCCDAPPGGSHQGTCPNSAMMTGEFLPDVNDPPPFQGASLTGQPVPWDLAGAAYELGRQRAMQDEVSLQVTAMIAEYDAKQVKR